jgi:hypothetical protein
MPINLLKLFKIIAMPDLACLLLVFLATGLRFATDFKRLFGKHPKRTGHQKTGVADLHRRMPTRRPGNANRNHPQKAGTR